MNEAGQFAIKWSLDFGGRVYAADQKWLSI